ncbi:MAG TPA: glycosyltransferase [Candidatus Saccharimonadales bacterium]|nr:glycosyltransferase [Candidatus Saccharimonadales bacterium]
MKVRTADIILIRNAQSYDFGGGEKTPVFIAREIMSETIMKPLIFSHSKKLLDFAKANGVKAKDTWWWSCQNWSGRRAALSPVYFLWQIVLFSYYLLLFIRYNPSVVHLQSKDDFIAGTYAARILGIKVIWSDYADLKHIFVNHSKWYKNPIGKAVYLAAHFASIIVVVSKEDLRLISQHIPNGEVKAKMRVVYNGAFDSNKHVSKYKKFTFISTGRLVTDKGIKELIEAFIRLNDRHPETRLYLVGDGPEKSSFEELARMHKSVSFLGYKQDPLEYVAKSHVFILPTYHEGFSLAIVEACMLAMPIITTNVGGNPEIIKDRKTGLMIPIRNDESLERSMEELYNNKDLAAELGKNARATYEANFNFKTIIKERFLPLYETTR